MASSCAICNRPYEDHFDERTCEECGRSVCVDHWGGLAGRICSDCSRAADVAAELVERKARALDALAVGIPMPWRWANGWHPHYTKPAPGSLTPEQCAAYFEWSGRELRTAYPALEDAVLAAATATGLEG
jgi:hypothetical protein